MPECDGRVKNGFVKPLIAPSCGEFAGSSIVDQGLSDCRFGIADEVVPVEIERLTFFVVGNVENGPVSHFDLVAFEGDGPAVNPFPRQTLVDIEVGLIVGVGKNAIEIDFFLVLVNGDQISIEHLKGRIVFGKFFPGVGVERKEQTKECEE